MNTDVNFSFLGKVTKKGGKLLRQRGGKIIKQQKRYLIRKGVKLAKKTQHRLTKTINKKAAQSSIKNIFNTTQLPSKSRRTRKTIGKRGGQGQGVKSILPYQPPSQLRYKSHHHRHRRRRRRTMNPRRSIRYAIERGFIPDRGQISY